VNNQSQPENLGNSWCSGHINLTIEDPLLSRGSGAPVYLEYQQHENDTLEHGDLIVIDTSKKITTLIQDDVIQTLSENVRKQYKFHAMHAVFDILYIPHDYILSEPSEEFNRMLEHIYGFRLDAKLLGYKELICQNTKKKKRVYIPVYDLKALPSFSPIKKYLSRKNSCNRVISQLEKIKEVDYILQIVLTIPHDLKITIEDFKTKVKQFIKRVEKELFNGDKLGGFYNIHIWSSRKPMEKHLHVHILIPNAILNSEGKLIRFQPYFSEKNLKKMRKIWSEIVGKSSDIHVSYAPKAERSRILHLFKYASRHPLIDFAYYYVDNKFDEKDSEKIREILEYDNRRMSFGWCRKLKQFAGKPDEDEDRCPLCGGKTISGKVFEKIEVDMIVFFDWSSRCLKFYSKYIELKDGDDFDGDECEPPYI